MPILSALLLLPNSALAGGIGLVGSAGSHVDTVYSYYEVDSSGATNQREPDNQMNSNMGGGVELILGDRDNKILGVFRGYYLRDSAQKKPDNFQEGDIYAVREVPKPRGVVDAGIQWGLIGDPGNIQFTAVSTIGTAFLSDDLSEYYFIEAGLGGTWMAERHVQVAVSITGGTRYRKGFFPTANGYVGARWLFD